jgi:hypothetical protein
VPLRRLFTDYSPHPEERSFMERAQTQREGSVEPPLQCRGTGRANEYLGSGSPAGIAGGLVGGSGGEQLWLDRVQVIMMRLSLSGWRIDGLK